MVSTPLYPESEQSDKMLVFRNDCLRILVRACLVHKLHQVLFPFHQALLLQPLVLVRLSLVLRCGDLLLVQWFLR